MAQRVVDGLEAVEVQEHERHQATVAVGPGQGLGEAVPEQHPVAEAGQVVIARHVRQPLLRPLALGDIDDGVYRPLEVPVRVRDGGRRGREVLSLAASGGYGDFVGTSGPVLAQGRPPQGLSLPLFFVQGFLVEEFEEGLADEILGRQLEDRGVGRVAVSYLLLGVDDTEPLLDSLDEHAILLLGLLQRLLRLLALGDVPDDRDEPGTAVLLGRLDAGLHGHPTPALVEDHGLLVVFVRPTPEPAA